MEACDESSDGDTTKLVVLLSDGLRVETVCMRYSKRTSVCVSSQVGCAMGCTFCATGTMGIVGDLSAGEIVEQLLHARRVEYRAALQRTAVAGGNAEPKLQTLVRNVVFVRAGQQLARALSQCTWRGHAPHASATCHPLDASTV